MKECITLNGLHLDIFSLYFRKIKEKGLLCKVAPQLESGNPAGKQFSAAAAAAAVSLQLCPTLCDPIDGSPPGSPVPGILQARTLEWVAISFYKRRY